MTDLERRQRALKVAIRTHGPMGMRLEDVHKDFLEFVGDSDTRLLALEMAKGASKMGPVLQDAQRLATLLEPPKAKPAPISAPRPSAKGGSRRKRG